jgi:hypothetical protein
MPSVSDKQRRFMGVELGRKRAGQPTDTKMSESQLEDFAKAVMPSATAPKARPLPMRKGPPPKKNAPLSARNPTPMPDRGTKEPWEH